MEDDLNLSSNSNEFEDNFESTYQIYKDFSSEEINEKLIKEYYNLGLRDGKIKSLEEAQKTGFKDGIKVRIYFILDWIRTWLL